MRKKVLILTELTTPYTSGSGINALNFAKALTEKGHLVKIISLNWGLRQKGKEIIHHVIIRRFPFFYNKYVNRGITLLLLLPFCICQFFFYDAILVYGRYPGLKLLILAGWILKRKIIFQSTALGHDDFDTYLQEKFVRNKLYGYYSLSPAFTRIFLTKAGKKTILFESPQGVDINVFSPVTGEQKKDIKKKLGLPIDKKIIVTIANVIRRKGFEDVYKTLGEIEDHFIYIVVGNNHKNLEYYFWQNRNEMDFLAYMGKDLLGDKIIFAGRVDQVEDYLKAADIFLLNSEKEGLPNSILEAMACGVVPVFKQIEGLSGYIAFHEENAIIFNTREEMKTALLKVLNDRYLRRKIGKNALTIVKEKCSMEKVVDAFIKKFF